MENRQNNLVKRLYSDESAKPTKRAEQSSMDDRRKLIMVTLWQRLSEIFGNQWELNFGPVGSSTFVTWSDGLASFSEDQIREGVTACARWNSGFVPHLGQFAQLCAGGKKRGTDFTAERIEAEKTRGAGVAGLVENLTAACLTVAGETEMKKIAAMMAGEDIETKKTSYDKLQLARRWGRLQ